MDLNQEYSDEKGLSYEEYLKMLVLLQMNKKNITGQCQPWKSE